MRAGFLALALVVQAGCSLGGEEKTIDEDRVDDVVLQREDLGAGYDQRFVGSVGVHLGWDADVRYTRRGSSPGRGAQAVTSRVKLLRSSREADGRLDAERRAIRSKPQWKPIDEPGLGDESFAATSIQQGLVHIRFYDVYWRDDNAVATLRVNGFDGRLAFADVLALARRQEERIAAAAA